MKIDNSLKTVNGLPSADSSAATPIKPPASAEAASETVQISRLSSQLQEIGATQSNDAVFDTNKVDAIKLAISDGRFQVDTAKVADGLINTVKDLLKTGS